MGLLVLLLLMVSGLAATAASGCNSGWSRSPDTYHSTGGLGHYWAGGQAYYPNPPGYVWNGASTNMYITNPTVNATGGASAWVAIQTNNGLLVQDGMSKVQGGTDQTFYAICDSTSCLWHSSNTQGLTVGSNYAFDVYYQGGDAYFDFAGVQKAKENINSCCGDWGLTDSTAWSPLANSEVGNYAIQMPGTATNNEYFGPPLESRRWAGSGTTWDATQTDQNYSTNGFPNGWIGDGVTQTRIDNSFKNGRIDYPDQANVYNYDTCSTS